MKGFGARTRLPRRSGLFQFLIQGLSHIVLDAREALLKFFF